MRKILVLFALMTVVVGAWAQKVTTSVMKVQLENGAIKEFTLNPNMQVTWEQIEHEYVDLGLPSGVVWATCNLGASRPEDGGYFYAWGETEHYYISLTLKPEYKVVWKKAMQNGYNPRTYCNADQFVEWNPVPYDENGNLKPEHDAAHVNWGGQWRIPTHEEMEELFNNCYWSYIQNYNDSGMSGYLVTSQIEGYTDKSIFFPINGYFNGTTYYDGDKYCGMYWTATHGVKVVAPTYERYADAIELTASKRKFNPGYRHPGYSIRPVFTKPITQ